MLSASLGSTARASSSRASSPRDPWRAPLPRPPEANAAPVELTESPFKGKTGVIRIVHAFFNSIAGLEDAWRNESAFRQEILLAIVLIPIACIAPVMAVERALLIGSVLLVI